MGERKITNRATRIAAYILHLVQQKKKHILEEIASQFGISIRTVQRIIRELRAAGFAIDLRTGPREPRLKQYFRVGKRRQRRLPEKTLARIAYIKEWNGKISNYQIALNLDVDHSEVYRLIRLIEKREGVILCKGRLTIKSKEGSNGS